MKFIKIAATIAIVALAGTVMAQGPQTEERPTKTPQERSDEQTSEMVVLLELDDDQTQKVNTINLQAEQEMEDINREMKALKERKKAVNKQRKTELNTVLTPEQQEKYKLMRKENKMKKRGARGEKQARPQGDQ